MSDKELAEFLPFYPTIMGITDNGYATAMPYPTMEMVVLFRWRGRFLFRLRGGIGK